MAALIIGIVFALVGILLFLWAIFQEEYGAAILCLVIVATGALFIVLGVNDLTVETLDYRLQANIDGAVFVCDTITTTDKAIALYNCDGYATDIVLDYVPEVFTITIYKE